MTWILLLAVMTGAQQMINSQSGRTLIGLKRNSQIVFVCEHGAALSVVSAAYFNKIAREQRLNLHAIARGTTPQRDLSVTAREGLKADGIALEAMRPQALSHEDVERARRIVAFCPIPARYAKKRPVETWTDVSWPAASYGQARDAILKHLQVLIQELKAEKLNP